MACGESKNRAPTAGPPLASMLRLMPGNPETRALTAQIGPADDLLLHQLPRPFAAVSDSSANWFDRFYFNLSAPANGPMLVVGTGSYANAGVMDGYACLLMDGEQRNRRFSRRSVPGDPSTQLGPFRWSVVEPLRSWRLELSDDREGFGFDVIWAARSSPYAVDPITVAHPDGEKTDFSHFFQPGEYHGVLRIDGKELSVDGWRGLRDRSWGVRRTRERLGMHLWGGAQLPDRCIAVLYNEDREGRPVHVDGAILPADGSPPIRIVDVKHDLRFDASGEFVDGTLYLVTESGNPVELTWLSKSQGLYMSAAGYDGWHGQDRGEMHQEHERWAMDGSRTPLTLPMSLVNKPCSCLVDGEAGYGVFETAVTRSASYAYRPSGRG